MNETIAPSTAPAPPAQAATPPAAPTVSPVVEPSGVSPQAAKMAQWTREDVALGKVTPEAAAKIFDELGIPADQRLTPDDTRSEEHRLVDSHFPPAKENDFLIRYYPAGREPQVMPKELQEFDQTARTWLSGAEFPRELGNSLVTEIERVAQQTKAMTPGQLEQYGYAEFAKLERAFGGEAKLQEKLRSAALMIHDLDQKKPGLKNLLNSKGIGDSALVVSQLIAQAERYHTRRKGR